MVLLWSYFLGLARNPRQNYFQVIHPKHTYYYVNNKHHQGLIKSETIVQKMF